MSALDLESQISDEERRQLPALHAKLPHLRRIPFAIVLTTPYLVKPLRRTLDAQKRAAEAFTLKP